LAFENHQGFGFCELNGDDWLYPELGGQPINIINAENDSLMVIIADNDGRPYVLSTRRTSTATGQAKRFVDKHGDTATEIVWLAKLKEHKANEENFKIRFIEDYWYFRPEDEANKGASGYDDNGFRDGQIITLKAYLNGDTTKASEIHTTDPLADLVHPYVVEARRVQLEISGPTSEMVITGTKALYDILRRRQPPGSSKELIWQGNLRLPIFWLSRASTLSINRVTGLEPDTIVGSITLDIDDATTGSSGPDGYFNTAIQFESEGDKFEYASQSVTLGRYITFGIYSSNNTGEFDIYREVLGDGSDGVRVYVENGDLKVDYESSNQASVTLTDDTWYMFLIAFDGETLNIRYFTSSLSVTAETEVVIAVSSFTGTIRVSCITDVQHKLYDLRVYSTLENANDAFDSRDIFTYEGKSLLPLPNYYDEDSGDIVETGIALDTITESGSQDVNIIEDGE
jgi:hypothetical protein